MKKKKSVDQTEKNEVLHNTYSGYEQACNFLFISFKRSMTWFLCIVILHVVKTWRE